MKREPGAWGYNWATLFLGDINTETSPPGLGLDARLMTLLCKKITVVKSKEVKSDGLIHNRIGKSGRIF
jgi:hypothetical protein